SPPGRVGSGVVSARPIGRNLSCETNRTHHPPPVRLDTPPPARVRSARPAVEGATMTAPHGRGALGTALVVGLAVTAARADGPPAPPRADILGDPLPPGAVARLGSVRGRTTNSVTRLAFSPDSRTVASVTAGD